VLFKENRICTSAVTGTAVTKYSGTQQITTDSVSPGVYNLRDMTRAGGVVTYNLAKGTNYGTATVFTDADNLWNTTTNQDDAANDAHFGAEKTYDYYLSIHGRNSYDNAGGNLLSYVHYSTNYNNAFWDGIRMTYGDGNGVSFSPLTELDICGHELSHGVTEYSSNLTYSYESGALNEAFSDIFGVTIDFFANGNNADWLIGNKSYTPATPNDALRFMNNPNLGGQPDTYKGTNWTLSSADNGGVHTNSGVLNYWYYLLSQGGSGTNDKGFVFNVAGIGINKARMIAYRTNAFYLTSGSQYVDAGVFSIQAANDIYGMCSTESFAVKNAWDAVGITGLNILSGTTATGGSVCTGSNLQLNASGGNTYSWTGPNGFTSSLQNPVVNSFNSTKAGTYTCVITYIPGCSATNTAVAAIKPTPTVSVLGAGSVCQGSSLSLDGTATSGGGNSGVNSTPLAIPDNPSPAVTSSIFIDNAGLANSVVSVKIDSLTHTWMSDVKAELIAPNGSSIIVVTGVGSSGSGFVNTVFSSTSTTAISGTSPFTGTYKPNQSFSLLTGSGSGEWKLRLTDLVGADVGTLWKWSLVLTPSNSVNSTWSPSIGLSTTTGLSTVASPSSTTSYTLTVSNTAGCTATASANVNVNIPHAINLKNNNPYNVCPSSPVTLNAGAGTSYLWNTGATTPSINISSAGNYWVNVDNCSKSDTAVVVQYASNPLGQLKIILQGFYAGSGLMTPVLYNAGLSTNNTDCDSVTVEIRNSTSPFSLVQSSKGILKTNGDVLFTPLCNCISRDYFVVVRTRNGIETWSKNPVHFNSSTLYRFDD
jgi:subtilisin-like proprotein convertase family protein